MRHMIFPAAGGLLFVGIYFTSLYSYILFHCLVEIFAVIIAACIFVFAWNARNFMENNYLSFIGVAYFFIGFLDLFHTLAYKGMGVFPGYGADLPTQLWIAGRYTESFSLAAAFIVINRKVRFEFVFAIYSLFVTCVLLSIFTWNIFPGCYSEDSGLTGFKIVSEYTICLILMGVVLLLKRYRDRFDRDVYRLLVGAVVLTICSELLFTQYISVYGLSNLVGHCFKVISFYLVYKAVIETGFKKPHQVLYMDLKHNEAKLKWESSMNSALAELAGSLITSTSMSEISCLVLRLGKDLTGSEIALVSHICGEASQNVCTVRTENDPETCSTANASDILPHAMGALDWVLKHKAPLVVNQPQKDPRFLPADNGLPEIHNFICVPSVVKGEALGQISMINPGREYTDDDLTLVERLADLHALAVQRMREEEDQKKKIYREFMSMETLQSGSSVPISELSFGQGPLRTSVPDQFKSLVEKHGILLDRALEENAFKMERRADDKIRDLAWQLGFLQACPRDVIEVHMTSLKRKCQGVPPKKANAYADEGRMVVLKLMGYLASYYRMQT